eukprot:1264277-Pleurochrysis_carterae.AAC.2
MAENVRIKDEQSLQDDDDEEEEDPDHPSDLVSGPARNSAVHALYLHYADAPIKLTCTIQRERMIVPNKECVCP